MPFRKIYPSDPFICISCGTMSRITRQYQVARSFLCLSGGLLSLLVVSIYAQDANHSDAFINSIMTGRQQVSRDDGWTWELSEDGVLELVDLSQTPVDIDIVMRDLNANIIFYLFTVSNPEIGQIIDVEDENCLDKTNFKIDKPTRFIIHGWRNSVESEVSILIRDAYLNLGKYNVIVVDWSYYAKDLYVLSRQKIIAVGQYVAYMIDYLERHHMSLDHLIVVGYSLGAHVAGVACRNATNTVAGLVVSPVAVILTFLLRYVDSAGLDPAGPLFLNKSEARMRSTDAEFVEVIHTNAGQLGYDGELGDVDFWPNGGGKSQLGCGRFDICGICAHSRSYEYFAESVTADSSESCLKFIARQCESLEMYVGGHCAANNFTRMGGSHLDTSAKPGRYYLHTRETSPYALGHPQYLQPITSQAQ